MLLLGGGMRAQRGRFFSSLSRAGSILLFVLVIAGCGKSRPTGIVTGKVTYQNATVTDGTVTFHGADGKSTIARIESNGTYKATKVPLGEVKVTVTTMGSTAELEKTAQSMAKFGNKRFGKGKEFQTNVNIVSVPTKYSIPDTSGLSLTVKQGMQSFNIDLP